MNKVIDRIITAVENCRDKPYNNTISYTIRNNVKNIIDGFMQLNRYNPDFDVLFLDSEQRKQYAFMDDLNNNHYVLCIKYNGKILNVHEFLEMFQPDINDHQLIMTHTIIKKEANRLSINNINRRLFNRNNK